MFGRGKTTNEQLTDAVDAAHPSREGAKNRPTPKRREQEAARKQPLVVTDRKLAREQDRAKRREGQVKMRQAMVTGDDRNLPARDKGPVRRFVRDYVDARWSVGEFMLPVMVIVLALTFIAPKWPAAYTFIFLAVYGLVFVAAVDMLFMWRRLRKQIAERFTPEQTPRGLAWYATMRAFQMRRTRMPRPLVKRGESPVTH